MELSKFEERLKNHNWYYQKSMNMVIWSASQQEYKKLIELSFTSPDHRKMFIRYKVMKGII